MADPGFPPGGGVNPPRGSDFAKFSQKLHEIETVWTPRGACVPNAPLRSANEWGRVIEAIFGGNIVYKALVKSTVCWS